MLPAPTEDSAWFSYLRYAIQKSVEDSYHGSSLSYRLSVINTYISKLIAWCTPQSAYPNTHHIEVWAPCGYAQLSAKKEQRNRFVHVVIVIQKTFSILLNFTQFIMDDSGAQCLNSKLRIGQLHRGRFVYPRIWTYCGQRRPWIVVVDSYGVKMIVIQKNVRIQFHIIFIYSVICGRSAEILRMASRLENTKLSKNNKRTVSYYSAARSSTNRVIYNWMLTVDFGYIIKFISLKTCCFLGFIDIFDGFEELHKLFTIKKRNTTFTNSSFFLETTYFKSLLKLHIDEYNISKRSRSLVALTVIRIAHPIHLIHTNSNVTIKHLGMPLYKIFRFNTNSSLFPKVSFVIRKFEGINEGGCNFGGYAIDHLVSHKQFYPVLLGPYCSGAASNIPLIDGIPYLVFGIPQTYLIIYAYGPYYKVDIDVIVQGTECEGIVEPIMGCPFNLRIPQTGKYPNAQSRGRNYLARCVRLEIEYMLIDVLAGCIIVQSIILSNLQTYSLEIKGNVELYIYYQRPELLNNYRLHNDIADAEFNIGLRNLVTNVATPTTSMTIWEESISYLRIWQPVINLYEYPSYLLYVNTTTRTFECATVSEDSHVRLKDYYEFMVMLTITNFCGLGTYSKTAVYIYKYMIQPTTRVTKLNPTMYMIITTKICQEASNASLDVITMVLRDVIFHSLDVIGDRTLYSKTVDMTMNLLYEKASLCSTFQLQYRVEEVRDMIPMSLSIGVSKYHFMLVRQSISYMRYYMSPDSASNKNTHTY